MKVIISTLTRPGGEGFSESLIEKLWPEFRSVSHLWAAFDSLIRSNAWNPDIDEGVIEFLSLAESFRKIGEAYRILDQEETWRFPEHITASEEPPIHPFEEDIIELLKINFPGV